MSRLEANQGPIDEFRMPSGTKFILLLPRPRCAGLTNETEGAPFLLEASQGDSISGKVSREEVASLVVAAFGTPAAAGAGSDRHTHTHRQADADRQAGVQPDQLTN
jgi:hypothetical protein